MAAPLMVVSGVAGSGKTSLVSQWIERNRLGVAWYSLDMSDNDENIFFRYLRAALSAMDKRSTLMIATPGETGTLSNRDSVFEIIKTMADLPYDTYLVLDDYHFITSPVVHEAVTSLLNHIASNTHVVILTRYDVPFSLSPFRMKNKITEIPATEMRFTEGETERFFTDIIPVSLTANETREIAQQMEGWVGGLQLLGLSLKEKGTSEDLGGLLRKGNRQAWDYLIDEVITVQPPGVRTFLESTAPLDRFDAEVARKVAGIDDAAELLERVYRNNLFLVSLDSTNLWYRYHHLLSEAVRERMKITFPDRLRQIHQQAALCFARRGYLEDAFRNAFASEDFEFAADLLEDYLIFTFDRYEYASGRRWLSKLPPEIFSEHMLLRLHNCGQMVEAFRLDEVESTIRDIEEDQDAAFRRYTDEKRHLCEIMFTYFRYVLLHYYRDPAHPNLGELRKAASQISLKSKRFSAYVGILVLHYHLSHGDLTEAEALLQEISPVVISSGGAWARLMWFKLSAIAQRMQGRLGRSETLLREGFDFLAEKNLSETPLRYTLFLPMAWIYYHRNEIEKAREYAVGAVSYSERVSFLRDVVEGYLLLALIHLSGSRFEEARDCLQKVRTVTEQPGVSDASGICAEPWFARLSMAQGDMHHAIEYLNRSAPSLDSHFSNLLVHEAIARAELFFRQGLLSEAAAVLERLRKLCADRNMRENGLDIDAALAATLFAEQRLDESKRIMEEALDFAEIEGYVSPFSNTGFDILSLLETIKSENHVSANVSPYLRKIIGVRYAAEKGGFESHKGQRTCDLTERERQVLALMAMGYRYKEIAQRTFVTPETVKTHVTHIFGKLDVDSRAKAVRRARDLHLIRD
jgi:LuxR family transcriptional regulator, maltose regulon positive regulatory protein